MDWKICSSVCVCVCITFTCLAVLHKSVGFVCPSGWVVSCVHAYFEGTKSHWACYALQFRVYCRVKLFYFRSRLVWYGDSPSGICQQSVQCDSRYDWSFCIHNKRENPLHHTLAYLWMMQQNADKTGPLCYLKTFPLLLCLCPAPG